METREVNLRSGGTISIPVPGEVANLSMETYHAIDAVSRSGIVAADRSLAHYLVRTEESGEPTDAMIQGSAFHKITLEPLDFEKEFVVQPIEDRRLKAYKDWKKDLEAKGDERTHIRPSGYDRLQAMRDAALSHPVVSQMLREGEVERSFFWEDPTTGLLCRCRTDFIRTSDSIIIDLKGTADASLEGFRRISTNQKYFVQDSFYSGGVKLVRNLKETPSFVYVCVEFEPPHAIGVYTFDRDAKSYGADLVRNNLDRIKVSRETNEYPGYPEEIQTIVLPPWA